MGYCSEVALALTANGVKLLNKKLADRGLPPEVKKEVESLLSCADTHYEDKNSGASLWSWNWLKWYADFPDVKFIESLMGEMDAGEAEGADEEDYYYVRVGEYTDDSEIRGNFWDNPFNMGLIRSIEMHNPCEQRTESACPKTAA